MESPKDFLLRREREVDHALGHCLRQAAVDHDATEFVGKHPFASLGGGVVAGFLAGRLLLSGGRGVMSLRRWIRPLRSMAYASMLAMAAARTRDPDSPQ